MRENWVSDWRTETYDTIIDVRTPAEFELDHVPGAINLPVLSNEERIRVGTLHKQVSSFEARKVGAALIARNIATLIEDNLLDQPGGWRALLYCWRGGSRSQSFAEILGRIGWRIDVLQGGYKTFRKTVLKELDEQIENHQLMIVQGATGAGRPGCSKAVCLMVSQLWIWKASRITGVRY